MGYLTTHVLDTAQGCPGAGIRVDVFRIADSARTQVGSFVTNEDGRTDTPVLPEGAFAIGQYELVFAVGAYFRSQSIALAEPAFLDEVVIRFGVADSTAHYHVPLLVSPYSYSTYRGS